jgi:hypothetical protein
MATYPLHPGIELAEAGSLDRPVDDVKLWIK